MGTLLDFSAGIGKGVSQGLHDYALIKNTQRAGEAEERAKTVFDQSQGEYKKMQAAKAEIAAVTSGFNDKITELKKLQAAPVATPTLASYTGGVPSEVGTSYENAMGTSNLQAIANQNTLREQVPKLIGEHDKTVANIWNKYGFTDKAQGVIDHHYRRMTEIGKAIGPKAALLYAQNGPEGELFQGAQVKDDKEFVVITGRDGSIIRYNKQDGNYQILKDGTEKIGSHLIDKMGVGNGMEQPTLIQYDDKGNVRKVPVGPAVKAKDPDAAGNRADKKAADKEKQDAIKQEIAAVNKYWPEAAKTLRDEIKALKEDFDMDPELQKQNIAVRERALASIPGRHTNDLAYAKKGMSSPERDNFTKWMTDQPTAQPAAKPGTKRKPLSAFGS